LDEIVHETDDLYRLYRQEWVIVHTVSGDGEIAEPFVVQAHQHGRDTYPELAPEMLGLEAHTDNAGHFWVHLKLFKPNMKGEFKHERDARRFAEKQSWLVTEIVARNSKRDHVLRNFGRAA
jgi:hypothetical protein